MADVEEYFSCECCCLDHVTQFLYFFPQKDDDPEDDEMYFTVNANHLYSGIFPHISFNPCYWGYDFNQYLHFHFFRRIWIALNYIANPFYTRKEGVLDCADFQEKDLTRMDSVLSNLTIHENCESLKTVIHLQNKEWQLDFTITDFKDLPYELGWEINFKPGHTIFKRIKSAFKYIFGKSCGEQSFNINKSIASRLKGMISATIGANTIKKIKEDEITKS